ncbi:four helix bundle protein [Gaoshiqia sediminis]|uniref:Four helix bundle protein n=1 Tax=Gaoshiqia sediminis TaxID=2986998 RepID=A0AA41YDJ9_9BACT|nr:four helix bundle protein [Gaoshiqia sediminis]MCW0484853.1 four helix bundle protein [Gaoshiqia sediminis]
MSYKNLEIWQLAREVAIDIHKMTLKDLPSFEMYETGQQIRRSSKSTRSTIVEGYGRRVYQAEYYKFLTYSIASNDETMDHLECLWDTGSLKDKEKYQAIHATCEILGKKLNNFLKHFERK